MTRNGLDLAIIGNGRTSALVNPDARILWWCFPRFDGDPVFCRLLSGDEEKGFTDVLLDGVVESESTYLRNTAVVTTILTDRDGNHVKITDFAPRFSHYGRTLRPPQLIRIIEPLVGLPRITVRFRPTHDYGQPIKLRNLGSNHIRFGEGPITIRLTTDVPLSYIEGETPFVLTRPMHMVYGADEPFRDELPRTCREFFERTCDYWMSWTRGLALTVDWQDEIIRAAITLKLSQFEETGAIIAAHTTSIPEAPGSGRTWDYRFCWLRDAYFVVQALNRLGATNTMEDFISYILTIASTTTDGTLRPVYGIVHSDPMDEWIASALPGYRGDGPVRVGNAAAAQSQHDTYGSIILAATPMFFDRRLPRPGDEALFYRLEPLGEMAAKTALTPDAGLWEYRGRQRIHTHSAAVCWAGCQRLAAIAAHLGLNDRAVYWSKTANGIRETLLEKAWDPKIKVFTAALGSGDLDASTLLLPELGLIEPRDPRFIQTAKAIEQELLRGGHVMRYTNEDDFGLPETAFLVCNFWLIDAFWLTGRREDARDLFIDTLRLRNRYGLLSEDVDPARGNLWGNFPQTYSMSGLIVSGMRLSRSWEDRYWHGSS